MLKEEKNNQVIIYKDNNGETKVDVKLYDETIWLTQAQIAELFGKDRSVITKHINSILKEVELENLTCAKFAHVKKEENNRVKRQYSN